MQTEDGTNRDEPRTSICVRYARPKLQRARARSVKVFRADETNAPTIELGIIYGPRLQQGLSKVPFSGHPDGERLQFRLVKLHVPSSCCTLAITGVNKFLIL